ncbi:MAG TPA: efflux RND transporter periplasmic adaptor subunit [Pirellulales bacterium]|jgi:multidrug efflux system membrane fusion protein|nr:efflux RND transporter periplasmic adaptor subunit [Pirellulales bacterium]
MSYRALVSLILAIMPALAAGAGCHKQAPAATDTNQPPVVTVAKPIERVVTDYVDFTGRTDAVASVDVRARVTGYIVQMPFKEGSEVKVGDLLFEIDPRPYQAQYDHSAAVVANNEASLKLAIANNVRARNLARTPNAISQQDLDTYQATEEQARATLADSQAQLETARLNLDWTRVTSPINGQVSRYYLTIGNLVTQDQTLLTTVVALDPIYAYFDIDEGTILRVKKLILAGKQSTVRESDSIPIYMALQGEHGFPYTGKLNFVNNRIDPTTGTITVRAVFANPILAHGVRQFNAGMFVRVHLPLGQPTQALLVADQAIGTDQSLKFVYTVDEQNKVQYRRVTPGMLESDGLRVVDEGLRPDDRVVIAGLQLIRPGQGVQVEEVPMPTPAAAGSQESGAGSQGAAANASPPAGTAAPNPESRRPNPAQ